MKTARKILFYLIFISSCFGFGIVFEQNKFFPYYLIVIAYDELKAEVKARESLRVSYYHMRDAYRWVRVKATKAFKTAEDKPAIPAVKSAVEKPNFDLAERKIPAELLPLLISGIQLNAKFSVASGGGGIAIAGDTVVVADRMDRFFLYDSRKNTVRSAEYPTLPSQREAFYSWGKYGRSAVFRVHDIEYAKTGGKGYLIAAHETFDTKLKTTRLAVHRLQVDLVNLSPTGAWERIFESTPLALRDSYFGAAAGGRLAADGDFVYLTIGDYNRSGVFPPLQQPLSSQIKTPDFGLIIKLNIQTGARENISYGHRNPQGLTISAGGMVFSTEHGPRGGDELNLIRPGRNYGWPEVSLGTEYYSYSWPNNKKQGRHEGFELPVFSWVPAIAVSNLIEVQGFHDRWDGDLLVGSLKATSLYRLRRDGERIIYAEPIWIGQRIRDLAQLPNGTIVIWTDQTQLLFLTVDDRQLASNQIAVNPGLSSEGRKCLQCHHLGPTNPYHLAPSLSNIVDRTVASDNQFTKYSNAIKQVGGVWSRERLTKFLTDPAGFVPGTSMGMEPMTNLRKVNKLIDELERAK